MPKQPKFTQRLITRPPTHGIDDEPQYIHHSDPAWDHERINAEADVLEASDGDLDQTDHPAAKWLAGITRWSLHEGAVLTVPEVLRTEERPAATCSIGDYLTGEPTIYAIKLLSPTEWRRAIRSITALPAAEQGIAIPEHMAKFGLVSVSRPGCEPVHPPRDGSGAILAEWLLDFDMANPNILDEIGRAIFDLRSGLGRATEGKP